MVLQNIITRSPTIYDLHDKGREISGETKNEV